MKFNMRIEKATSFVLLLSFFLLAYSCSDEKRPFTKGNENQREKEVYEKIKGNWIESKNIDSTDSSHYDNTERWCFDKNAIKMNGYSHLYSIQKDTILISGRPYAAVIKDKDTMRLKDLVSNKVFLLIKSQN